MKVAILKETFPGEKRVAMVPKHVEKLVGLGATVKVEKGLGETINHKDAEYTDIGAEIVEDRQKLLAEADLVLRLRKPSIEEVSWQKEGSISISYLDPFNEDALVEAMRVSKVSAFSMEMIPRSTIAQKMDALSSQASLAGYVATLLAAENLDGIFPMMMTPAGTLSPARVFIIGAGVAGLQAIATAKRLGARVEAFDTRAVVETEVKSLGGKFIKIDLGETGQTKDGYAKALTNEQLDLQRQGLAKVCARSDVVITTAQLFGRPAPRILTKEMVAMMKPGSVIVDMAVESGGNVDGSELDKIVEVDGVKIIGYGNLPGRVPLHASQMYSSNLYSLIEELWSKDEKSIILDQTNEITSSALVTYKGEMVNETIKNIKSKS